jgi:putative membrane protein
MKLLFKILITALAIIITCYLLPGAHVKDVFTAVIVAVVLSLLNAFIKPLLILLTLPITIFTLGLFLLVINALIILLAARIVPGFSVDGFWWALLFSIIVSVISSLFSNMDDNRKRSNN